MMLSRFFEDVHSIAVDIRRIADVVRGQPDSLVVKHSEPTKESSMAKPKSLARSVKPSGSGAAAMATAPAGDKDTVTITVLDTGGNPYTGPLTFTVTSAVSSDPTVLTTDPPAAMTYGEHFLKAGSTTVHVVVTFSDGSTLSIDDSVVITGVPGSLVATHSIPIAGP